MDSIVLARIRGVSWRAHGRIHFLCQAFEVTVAISVVINESSNIERESSRFAVIGVNSDEQSDEKEKNHG